MTVLIALLTVASMRTDVDRLLSTYDQAAPGAAVAVVADGQVTYAGGFGIANFDYDIRITPETVFDIGSMAKQFTAACIHTLARDGALSLEGDVRKYIPELPDYGQTITVGHLVHHTSGLRDYAVLSILSGSWGKSDPNRVMKLLAAQTELDFAPGQQYHYSNSGYVLLAWIVERVSGRTLAQYAREKLFEPLGMKAFFNDDENQIIRGRAMGYVRESSGWTMKHDFVQYPLGARGVNASVLDVAKWQQFIASEEAGALRVAGKLANGEDCGYAFGLERREYRGLKTVGHNGYTGSFHCKALYFPAKNASIIALANGGLSSDEIVRKVADIVFALEPETGETTGTPDTVTLDPSVLRRYEGFYQIPNGPVFEVKREGSQLLAGLRNQQYTPIYPSSETEFFMKVSPVTFEFVLEDDAPVTLILNQPNGKMELPRLTEIPKNIVESDDYNGLYRCDELLGTTYRLYKRDGELFCDGPMEKISSIDPQAPLIAKGDDTFSYSVFTVEFTRTQDEVDGFFLKFSPGKGVRFRKVPQAAETAPLRK